MYSVEKTFSENRDKLDEASTAELEAATAQLRKEIENRVHVETLLAEAAMTDGLTGLLVPGAPASYAVFDADHLVAGMHDGDPGGLGVVELDQLARLEAGVNEEPPPVLGLIRTGRHRG